MPTSAAARPVTLVVCFAAAFIVVAITIVPPLLRDSASAATTITVNTSDDENTPNGFCSLKEAIIAANTDMAQNDCPAGSGFDTINFDLGGPGTPIIELVSDLDNITAPVKIDGHTGGATRIELHGGGNIANGLSISGAAAGTEVHSLVINGYTSNGIESFVDGLIVRNNFIGTDSTGTVAMAGNQGLFLGGTGAIIGGASGTSQTVCTGDCNLVSGNLTGIYVSGAQDVIIRGNFVGTNVSGTAALPNSTGVHNQGAGTILGGGAPGQGNLISGNTGTGVDLTAGATGAVYQGNRIGTRATGTQPLPNGTGLRISSVNEGLIGGGVPGQGNVISGNAGVGVVLEQANNLQIHGNLIGVLGAQPAGTADTPLGNGSYGILINDTSVNNVIGRPEQGYANVIANNGADGVRVDGTIGPVTGNQIGGNSIYSNIGLGIELIGGGNNEVDPPVITFADLAGASGTACPNCLVDVFTDVEDEGRTFRGRVTADGVGLWSYVGVINGINATSTSTDLFNNTSEFSALFILPSPPPPTPSPTSSPTPPATLTPTPVPTPVGQTPTPIGQTPTPTGQTPAPTPTPTGGGGLTQGDNDCDGDSDAVDALVSLQNSAGLPYNQQPNCVDLGSALPAGVGAQLFGDIDCDGDVDAVDALQILRNVAGLGANQNPGCTAIGEAI